MCIRDSLIPLWNVYSFFVTYANADGWTPDADSGRLTSPVAANAPVSYTHLMVRPVDPLFHLLADRFCHDGIGNFLVGGVLVGIAAARLDIAWTPGTLLYLVIMVLSGGVIFIALNLMTCVSAFWIMDSVPVTRVVFEMHEFAKYPLSIYPRAIGLLLTWAIPFGFASYFPAARLMGIESPPWQAYGAPVVAAVLLAVALQVWRFGLQHYGSTGT